MLKLIFIDTETTGSDWERSGVWQIGGLIECGKRQEEFLFECDIFDGDELDPAATEITGITLDKLTEMEDPKNTYDKFISLLDKYVDKYDKRDKFTAVNFCAEFDQKILRRWFEKNDDDYFGSWFWHPWLCMAQAAATRLISERSSMKNFKMDTVCEHFNIKIDQSKQHNALYDALRARDLYNKLIKI